VLGVRWHRRSGGRRVRQWRLYKKSAPRAVRDSLTTLERNMESGTSSDWPDLREGATRVGLSVAAVAAKKSLRERIRCGRSPASAAISARSPRSDRSRSNANSAIELRSPRGFAARITKSRGRDSIKRRSRVPKSSSVAVSHDSFARRQKPMERESPNGCAKSCCKNGIRGDQKRKGKHEDDT
jgi:hypothetical protein